MISFLQFLREFTFADLKPRTGQWEKIPTSVLQRAQRDPVPNIDSQLYDLIDKSYAYIGGYPDFKRYSDIPANHTVWFGMDTDADKAPDAVKFGKQTSYGTKWTGGATDGSDEAKVRYVEDSAKLLHTPGNYCEASDAIMHILITRFKVPCVESQAEVEKVIGKKVEWIGKHPAGKYPKHEGFYIRDLFGEKHMKILLGKPR